MPRFRRALLAASAAAGLVLAPASAFAHEERPVEFPDGSGSVPTYRGGEPDLLVCKTDQTDFAERIADFPAELKARNEQLFARCQETGFRHLQDAVDAVDRPGMNIAILPGVYLEEPSQPEPTGACARLDAPQSSFGYQVLSYEQQEQCPHNQNLVAILGIEDLQIEGTGADPLDVIVDAQYRKLNAIRADISDGIYFRNFTAQRTTFNSIYILGADGFVIDGMLTRWNDEYGFLTFASDHGLYTDCESYGNGDSGLYPGSASDVNSDAGYDVDRYSIEIRDCKSHHNMVGYSGTAGNSVWVHDNEFYANMGGAAMDSAFPGHPGLPQDHALFEGNRIYDNNADYYKYVADGTCAKPPAVRGYERGVVCPQIGMPPGTGIITAGGNYNVFRDNWIWGHERSAFNLLGVPAFIRGENSLGKQFDTSHRNTYVDNHLGVTPDGEQRANAVDVIWDGQGTGNCWQGDVVWTDGNEGSMRLTSSDPYTVPVCGDEVGDVSGGSHRILGDPGKLATALVCNEYSMAEQRLPSGCDWYGATGLSRIETQLALGTAIIVGLVGVLVWWRIARSRLVLALTVLGLAGLVVGVFGATRGHTWLPAVAVLLLGIWWMGLGLVLRRTRRVFGLVTITLGVMSLVDAFDKAVYLIPLIPLGPAWGRGLLTWVWVFWAVVAVAPRRSRADTPAAEPVEAAA